MKKDRKKHPLDRNNDHNDGRDDGRDNGHDNDGRGRIE